VPIPDELRGYLVRHRLRSGRGEGLVFGSGERPFDYWSTVGRAKKAWKTAGLEAVGLNEARHCFASLMIAAGVNAKALSTYMGHSSITITLDRYGHLMPGNEDEAGGLLDAYLEASRSRIASASSQQSPIRRASSALASAACSAGKSLTKEAARS
jgi:integrase